MPPSDRAGAEARTVAKATEVLLCFSVQHPVWRLSDIARKLGLSKTVVHRLLATLERRGFVARNADRSYSLGAAVLQLAGTFLHQGDLIARSDGPMRELWSAVGETVNLSIRVRDHRFCIHQLESPHALRYTLPVGQPLPLYAGTTGKLLLSTMSEQEVGEYLARTPLVPYGPRTITDPARLQAEVRLVRQRGYATSTEEMGPGGAGTSAAVYGQGRVPLAALSVFGPTARLSPRRLGEIASQVVATARIVSEALGVPGRSEAHPKEPPRPGGPARPGSRRS